MESVRQYLNIELINFSGQPITLGRVLVIPLILLVGYFLFSWGGRAMVNRMTRRKVNPDIVQLIRRAYFVLILAVLVMTALELLNVPLTAFAFVSGAVAIGVGFGAQNIINNFISGWILMWERPIRIGDYLELGDMRGTVESIDTRSTRIRRVDGVHLLIPNSHLLENVVVNWTLVDRLARATVRVGVAYGSPVKQVAALIQQAMDEASEILREPPPIVIFEDFGDNALVFDAYFWIETTAERNLRQVRSDIRFRIAELFDQSDIIIAFPQRDVHLDGSLTIKRAPPADRQS